MTAAVVVIMVMLAAYRATRFVVVDDLLGRRGVSGLYDGARGWWFSRFPPDQPAYRRDGYRVAWWRRKLGDLLDCPYCAGFWISGLVLAAAHAVRFAVWPVRIDVVLWWAVAGGQALLNAVDDKLGR